MKTRIRRVGNSNVLSIPRDLEPLGYVVGAEIELLPLKSGVVVMVAADQLSEFLSRASDQLLGVSEMGEQ